eukprot:304619_1
MSMLQPSSAYFRYIALTLYWVEFSVVFLVLLIELRTFYYSVYHAKTYASPSTPKSQESDKSKQSLSEISQNISPAKLIFILPILSYLFYVLTGICGGFSLLGVDTCGWFVRSGPNFYYLAKMFMYLVFTYRLYIVYSDSAFAYNNKVLLIVAIIIILYTFGIISANGMTLDVQKLYNVNQQRLCIAFANPLVLFMTILMDAIISVLCCYLFIRPLLILKKVNDNDDATNKHSQAMYHVILKYLILTFITVITTFLILILMVLLEFTALLTVDIIINSGCILLFNKFYDYYYKIICCAAIQICNKLCQSSKKRNGVNMMVL